MGKTGVQLSEELGAILEPTQVQPFIGLHSKGLA
jgi:hypothetical protein